MPARLMQAVYYRAPDGTEPVNDFVDTLGRLVGDGLLELSKRSAHSPLEFTGSLLELLLSLLDLRPWQRRSHVPYPQFVQQASALERVERLVEFLDDSR